MLAFTNVMKFLANELPGLGCRGLSLPPVAFGKLHGCFIRHDDTLLSEMKQTTYAVQKLCRLPDKKKTENSSANVPWFAFCSLWYIRATR